MLDGLEQERGAVPAQPVVHRQRRLEVGEDLAPHRHDTVRGCQFDELVAGRLVQVHGASGSKKQLRAPVWQATPSPCWSTRTSTTSPSQSARTSTTRWVLPEVSPLCQRSLRLRDQKTVSPDVRVSRSVSAFIHATMSTSPVSCCWTTA